MAIKEPKMEKRTMFKCEGCGEYHPEDECEIVIIKIIKGKNCNLSPRSMTPAQVVIPHPAESEKKFEVPPAFSKKSDAVAKGVEIPRAEPEEETKKKNLLPGGVNPERDKIKLQGMPSTFRGMFIPAESPGADVIRKES